MVQRWNVDPSWGVPLGIVVDGVITIPLLDVPVSGVSQPRQVDIHHVFGGIDGYGSGQVIGVGIYTFDGTGADRDPLNPADAQRPDWHYLTARLSPLFVTTSPFIAISLRKRILVGRGCSLQLAISVLGTSLGPLVLQPAIRLLVAQN